MPSIWQHRCECINSQRSFSIPYQYLICFISPLEATKCVLVRLVNDTYQELSIKNNTREQRGEDHIKTAIEGFEQHMPTGMK